MRVRAIVKVSKWKNSLFSLQSLASVAQRTSVCLMIHCRFLHLECVTISRQWKSHADCFTSPQRIHAFNQTFAALAYVLPHSEVWCCYSSCSSLWMDYAFFTELCKKVPLFYERRKVMPLIIPFIKKRWILQSSYTICLIRRSIPG